MTRIPNNKRVLNFEFGISNLFRISDFGFRASRPGVALLLAVLILASLLAIGLGIFDIVFGEIRITEELSDSFVALSAADQGIEQLLYNDLVADALPGCGGASPCTYGPVNVDLGSQRCTRLSLKRIGGGQTTAESIGEYRCGSALSVKRRLVTSYEKAATFGFSPDTGGGLETGLVAYWPLNETSGTRNDVKGVNHLTDNNTVTSNPGRVGNAAQFTKTNGAPYLSIGDTADLSMGGPEVSFTISAWFYRDSTTAQGLITKAVSGAGTSAEYALWHTGSGIQFYVADGTTLTTVSASTPVIGTWYFVTAWHDAALNEIAISINNGVAVTAPHTVGSYDSVAGLQLGSWGRTTNNWTWDGRIDEVGIWKRVLTAQERADLWNNGLGNTCASPCQ